MTSCGRNSHTQHRRQLILALGGSVCGHSSLLRAQSSLTNARRVGVLGFSTRASEEVGLKPFFDGMRALGWIEGQNIVYDRAYADEQPRELSRLAVELVARKPELIYAPAQVAALAAKRATSTIPIIFGSGLDPVGAGLVVSLGHPGGNVTGVVGAFESLAPKRIELLREILPAAKRIGFLGDPSTTVVKTEGTALVQAAKTLGVMIVAGDISNPLELDAAVARLLEQGVDAIYGSGVLVLNLRERLIELANRRRLPVIGGGYWAGDLFNYGEPLRDQIRRSANSVDKILKGAKPADVPVEQATKFNLVINLKTAKALGITIPQSLLLRADEVIQ